MRQAAPCVGPRAAVTAAAPAAYKEATTKNRPVTRRATERKQNAQTHAPENNTSCNSNMYSAAGVCRRWKFFFLRASYYHVTVVVKLVIKYQQGDCVIKYEQALLIMYCFDISSICCHRFVLIFPQYLFILFKIIWSVTCCIASALT